MSGSDPSFVDARYLTPDGPHPVKSAGTARVRAVPPRRAVPPANSRQPGLRRGGAWADGSRTATCGGRPPHPQPTDRSQGLRQTRPASDAAALGRTAAVVRSGRDVLDRADLEAGGLEGADRGLTAGAGTLDEHVHLAHAMLLRAAGGRLGGHLRGEGGGLARALEADVAGGGPGDHVARGVRDRDDGVVERALDVRVAVSDVLLFLAAHLLGSALTTLGGHLLLLRGGGRSYSEDR